MEITTITYGWSIALAYAFGCITGCAAFCWALREIVSANRESRDAIVNISERAMDRVHARHLHEIGSPAPATNQAAAQPAVPDVDKVFEDQLDAWAGKAALTTAAVPEKEEAE